MVYNRDSKHRRQRHGRPAPREEKISNKLEKPIVFFCKDCEKIVEVKPVGRKFAYTCGICKTKNVAFGTEDAVRSFYRIEDGAGVDEGKETVTKVDMVAVAKGNVDVVAIGGKKVEVEVKQEGEKKVGIGADLNPEDKSV